ncbi:MAG: hypothetical protein NTU69_01370, partial [Proteobacteria bacterium]|nr:hypothetical protein [Pseudomonadota bacterium]
MDPDENTSHELRRALNNIGWGLKMGDDQVLLIKPTENGDTSFADELLGDDSESEESEDEEEIEAE